MYEEHTLLTFSIHAILPIVALVNRQHWDDLLFAVSNLREDSFYSQNRAADYRDNDSAGNSLVVLQISEYDGILSNPVEISTGGKGLAGLAAVSQDSVVVDGNVIHLGSNFDPSGLGTDRVQYIFTVNAGDNTFSLLQSVVVTQYIPSSSGTHCLLLAEHPFQ